MAIANLSRTRKGKKKNPSTVTTATTAPKSTNTLNRRVFKPRHGLRMSCKSCGWVFRGGGYQTKKQAQAVEKTQKKVHELLHKQVRRPPTLQEQEVEGLQVERDYHSAEITHSFVEQTTRQPVTSTTYTDVPGVVMDSSNFTPNQDHLVIVTAQMDMSTNSDVGSIRIVRGTTPTVMTGSEASMENPSLTDLEYRMPYQWWVIINTPTAETVKMQVKASAGTVGVDLITISMIRLSPDLTVNVDYKHSLNSTATSFTSLGTDLATNNASVSITPADAGHKWLILGKARYGTGIDAATAVNSRIERSGVAVNSFPQVQQEGEDATLDQYVLTTMRTDTLTAESHTYTEISKQVATTTGTALTTRTQSGIFMLDLNKFMNVVTLQEDDTQELPNSTTGGYAENVHTTSITPTLAGDVLCLGYITMDAGGSGFNFKMRMQIDDSDPQANTTTTKAYNIGQWDTADRIPVLYQTIENLSAAVAHTIDIDGSVGTTGISRGTLDRNITAFTMEMSAGAVTAIQSDTVGIGEEVVFVKGTTVTKMKEEVVGIGEEISVVFGSPTNFIIPSYLQLRLSGGINNVDPDLSLGGSMSTVTQGAPIEDEPTVITADYSDADFTAVDYNTEDEVIPGETTGDFTSTGFTHSGFIVQTIHYGPSGIIIDTLFDDVSMIEAQSGDPTPDHRCFYVVNTHSSLTMIGLRIWIAEDTQADDFVEIGLGTSAIGSSTVEQDPTGGEEGIPSGVVFETAASRDSALIIGNLPAGQHKAIWIRRTVPAGTDNPVINNKYILMAEFITDHV
jgi:hypothetical protein